MFGTAVSLLSMWASMTTWLTPTVLFLFLNIMIGTIAITSGFTTTNHHHHHNHNHHDNHHHQTPLARSPSVLQRLKSLSLHPYLHHPPPPTTHHQPPSTTAPDPGTETHHSPPPPEKNPERELLEEVVVKAEATAEEVEEGPTLDEVYNWIVRKENNSIHYGRQHSDTKPDSGVAPVPLPRKMKKIASDKSAFTHFEVAEVTEQRENMAAAGVGGGGDVEVDAMADDFINNFRQQLKLQRLESLYGTNK